MKKRMKVHMEDGLPKLPSTLWVSGAQCRNYLTGRLVKGSRSRSLLKHDRFYGWA